MNHPIKLLDVVALINDIPKRGLIKGQVGTIVEELDHGVFEVEFSDDQGITYAQCAVRAEDLMVLYYQPQKVA